MTRNFRVASMVLLAGMLALSASLGTASENQAERMALQFNEFRLASALGSQTLEERPEFLNTRQIPKSANRAFLFSFIVPGSGQLYVGAKRGYAMLAADIAFLTAHLVINNDAENTREEYRQQVRENVIFDGPGTFDTWDEIEDFEHATLFDNWHNVYTDNNGEPLDRTGKWYWGDRAAFKDDDRQGADDSPLREDALALREDANDKFELARNFLGLAILNHIVSAVDARIATKSYNNRLLGTTMPRPLELDMQTTLQAHAVESQIVLRKRF